MDFDDEVPALIEHEDAKRVPLTIICGFLGAGKSTLLKRILTEHHGYRIAVIMNEFGDTADIEAKTINVASPDDPMAENSEEFLELGNGCLCCSIKDFGIAAIEKLMEKKGAFDYILLETTGLADPGPIATMFWHNEEFAMGLGKDIVLDGVVCVVDAMFGKQQMQEDSTGDIFGESLRQIAGSDVILLNKVDLASPSELPLIEQDIRNVNPGAPLYKTIRGEIDLKHIIGIKAYSTGASLAEASASAGQPSVEAHDHSECSTEHNHDDHDHDHDHKKEPTHYELRGISSLQVTCPVLNQPQYDALDEWIRAVLWENQLPEDMKSAQNSTTGGSEQKSGEDAISVLRCKGLFFMEDGSQYVLQGVRSMYDIAKIEGEDAVGLPDAGKLVFIGKGLGDRVRESLKKVVGT